MVELLPPMCNTWVPQHHQNKSKSQIPEEVLEILPSPLSTSVFPAPQLVGVDVVAALDLYVEQGQWDKCIETATKQVLLALPFPPTSS